MIMEGRHHYPVRIYYEDTDAGGIVYHANYLRFAERARTEMLRDCGVPHAELTDDHGLMFVVRRVRIDYRRPALLDDLLTVVTRVESMGAASAELEQRVEGPEGELRALLRIGLACVKIDDQKPARVPDRWKEALDELSRSGTSPVPTLGEQ
ncbi:tol-pal system-associated acyl-CoA thioesterase [Granulibacter bethesdensis]|uniref:Short-chain acyl-CoA hydrolase n=1 Tax=Granulibacter bethesdensis (strain ATCC BAA-1260 / CGDNIH1) TaxID=391165 RepID=Q0BT52_GRABC|nr:tol-pal system-associated acyl-CoA thioesterase [Granulibacter bethesdensis]ABI62000.1 Short-chain acyl-CoA hydrolase [Granulibacter bethesdensis CGDNIH1]AHJ69104.1 Short-chain acyl-CoA hydrolase [Granulibacter bethesdensis]APH51820.1 Short-chain acyl-CoA hydrolase [Granulibacter bethesdensis]APH64511.1 Short-chain acyl-CoA hydrolase [Granulibacter bethesdensis]